ncbi:MAG: two-component regulator propeller domain-containing protein [Anaerolineales bacterium]
MLFRRIPEPKILSLIFLTSVLSAASIFLNTFVVVSFAHDLALMFWGVSVVLIILFSDLMFPSVKTTPGIINIVFFALGLLLLGGLFFALVPLIPLASWTGVEAITLIVSCIAAILFVWRKSPFRLCLTAVIFILAVSGIYIIGTRISVVFCLWSIVWVMSQIPPGSTPWNRVLEWLKTPAAFLNNLIAILIILTLSRATINVKEISFLPGWRGWVDPQLRYTLAFAIILASLSRFLPIRYKISRKSWVYWWGRTAVVAGLVLLSEFLLSQLPLLFGLGRDQSGLVGNTWIILTLVLGTAVFLWAKDDLKWQWQAITIGCVGGVLLSYLWTPLIYVITYTLFVPGQEIEGINFVNSFQLGSSAGFIVILLTGFLAVFTGKPNNRKQAIIAASLAGAMLSVIIFMSSGTIISTIASQSSLYGVAYSRAGYDALGFVSSLAEAVTYIFPWVYGVLAICFTVGLLPPLLIGLTWPVKKRLAAGESRYTELPVSALILTLGLSMTVIVQWTVFRLLDDTIMNTVDYAGVNLWWKPNWIVPLTMFTALLLYAVNTLWIFIKVGSLTKSFRNALVLCVSGLLLILTGSVIYFVAPESGLTMFVMVGSGIEMLRQGIRLWGCPAKDASIHQPSLHDALSSNMVSTLLLSFASLPSLVISVGLALIPIVAIAELRNVNAPPPGIFWLLEMTEDAVWRLLILSLEHVLWIFVGVCLVAYTFNFISEPVTVLYWWGKLKSLQEYVKRLWSRSFFGRIRSKDLNFFLYVMGAFVVIIMAGNIGGLAIILFPLSYLYLKRHPSLLRDLSWPGYLVAGFLLLTSVAANLFKVVEVISVLAGVALAVIYRGVVLHSYASRMPLFRVLFFPTLGVFFLLYTNYLAPISITESGIARFSDQRWENIGPENSPIIGKKNYLFLKDSQSNLWLSGHYWPEALRKGNEWVKSRVLTEQNTQTEERIAQLAEPGKLLVRGNTYVFVGETNLYIIVPTADGFASSTPSRPMPPQDPDQQPVVYGADADRCSNIVTIPDRECPILTKNITSAAVDQRGDIWVGTDGAGIAQFHQTPAPDIWDWKFFNAQSSDLLSDSIVGMLTDYQGNIWSLSSSSLSILSSQGSWTNYTSKDLGLKDSRLQTMYEDGQQRIWVGSSLGASAWDGRSWRAALLPQSTSVYSFYEDRHDQLWMLTASGAWIYSNAKWVWIVDIPVDPFWKNPFGISSFYRIEPYDTGIRTAIEDQDGYLWFGGPRGLARYNAQAKQAEYFYPSNSGLPSENVQDIEVDKDGGLWVSTYTQNTAHRSELPVLGFALAFISLTLGIIYAGYQRSPQYRASRIYTKLSERSQLLLPEIYGAFKDTGANEVLKALTVPLSSQRELSSLVAAYADIVETNEISSQDKAEQISKALQENSTLVGAAGLSHLYQFVSGALQVKSITDIGNLHLVVLRSSDGSKVTITAGDAPPFEFPALVDRTAAEALEMLGNGSALVRKYLRVESTQDRLSFVADSLSAIERAKRDAEHVPNPEGYFLLWICNLWLETISRELDVLSGHANLRVDFRTKQIRQSDEVTMMLTVANVGSAVADQVRISILPNDRIHLQARLDRQIEYISAGNSEAVEFTITTPPKGDVRVAGEVTWRDRIEANNRIEFADVIRFYETSDQFERIPNPYIVGHPVKSPKLFRGREDIFEFVLHNLQGTTQSRTLVLYGQRRTGKTSILYQLLSGRLGMSYIPVLLDVQELAPGINNMADMFVELAFHIEKALRKAGVQVAKPNEPSFVSSATRSFSRFLDAVEDQLAGRKIMLMFDEFELLEERIQQGKLEPEAIGYLRSLMQHRDDVVFLFTGTHKLEQMSKDYWSIFFNIALHQEVSFMDRNESIRLMRDPVLGKLSIDDLVVEKILNLTQGHPYFIQLLCWGLVNYCNKTRRNYATLNDFNDVLKEIISSGDAYFAYIWTQISLNERIVLAALAERIAPGKNAIPVQEITDAIAYAGIRDFERTMVLGILDGLIDQNILVTSGVEGLHYSYRVGLIGEWIKCSKSLRHLVERDL